jgi:hypothetical protein
VAWQHIGLGFDLLVDSYLLIWEGGYIPLGSEHYMGLYQVLCARGASAEVRVPTGAGVHMLGCFERGTGTVSGPGQGTTAGVEATG